MPGRIIPLVNGELYHLYNRGTEKRDIFIQEWDYKRFQQTFYYYQFLGPKLSFSKFAKSKLTLLKHLGDKKLIEIVCYCLMPNHFHFLIRQLTNNGISIFMSKLANSYTKYFNTKYDRVGPLLQGAFKAVGVETEEQFIHLSRYIHLNPIVSGIGKDLDQYQWSSYPDYLQGNNSICSAKEILNLFPSIKDYQEFVEEQIEYGTTLEIIKHQALDI